jgi:hypothetical protein
LGKLFSPVSDIRGQCTVSPIQPFKCIIAFYLCSRVNVVCDYKTVLSLSEPKSQVRLHSRGRKQGGCL